MTLRGQARRTYDRLYKRRRRHADQLAIEQAMTRLGLRVGVRVLAARLWRPSALGSQLGRPDGFIRGGNEPMKTAVRPLTLDQVIALVRRALHDPDPVERACAAAELEAAGLPASPQAIIIAGRVTNGSRS